VLAFHLEHRNRLRHTTRLLSQFPGGSRRLFGQCSISLRDIVKRHHDLVDLADIKVLFGNH
jgi:hypothetical protein